MEGGDSVVNAEEAGGNPKGGKIDLNDVENAEEYQPGGYHPITPGDVLGGR